MPTISVVLATYNEEKTLEACLDSIKGLADEIVVVDGMSTDKTVDIAKKFGAKTKITTNKPIFHINKQMAIDMATKDWVLQLDADERLSTELIKEIQDKIRNQKSEIRNQINGYWIPRKHSFLGRFLMKGGIYPDYTLRLYKRGKGKLPQKSVHEQAEVSGIVDYLKNPLIHMADPTFGRYLIRWNRYTNLIRDELKKEQPGFLGPFNYLFLKPILWFILTYIRHKGFMDGWQGFIFSFFSSLRFPVSYIKYLQEKKSAKFIIVLILISVITYNVGSVIVAGYENYFKGYYTDQVYKSLEDAFNSSQYRKKDMPGLIPDETVFSYAAGAYLKGVDPILINSEHTPLGKYLIALSILFLKNDKFMVIPFGLLSLFSLWLLGSNVLGSKTWALIPPVFLSSEKVFIGQLTVAPLLDIIQLPFILFSIYFFLLEYKKRRFFITTLFIGLVMATKSVVPGLLLIGVFSFFLLSQRYFKTFLVLLFTLPISAFIFIAAYTRTFLSGYDISAFIGFQKWIFLYQQSKLIFPFSFWKLALFNQWQAWWGEMKIMKADDWQITWPIFTILPFILITLVALRKIKLTQGVLLILIWIFVYEAFLSLGVVSSRFLLPLLPALFVIGIYTIRELMNIYIIKND